MPSRSRAGSRRHYVDVSHATSRVRRAESDRTATRGASEIGNRARGALLSGGRQAGKAYRQSDPRAPKPASREEEREALERALPAIAHPIEAEGGPESKGDSRAAEGAMPRTERCGFGRAGASSALPA